MSIFQTDDSWKSPTVVSNGEELRKGANQEDKATKYDFGKLRWDLMPYDALEKLIEVFSHGAAKYNDENWRKGMSWKRMYRAAISHLQKAFRGRDIDEDSGCWSLAMTAWYCLCLINYQINNIGTDDRILDLKDENFIIRAGNQQDIEKQVKMFWDIVNYWQNEREKGNV